MVSTSKTKLNSGWIAARSTEINLTGLELTTTNPPPSLSSSPWIEALIPGTVLGTLLKNKLVPDPFYGLNNEEIIDIADSGRDYYTFWFYTTFHCAPLAHQYVDLNFRAINYSAEVYVNGHKKVLPKGMFRRHSLDVTDILHLDGQNFLAVLVNPPDHPGKIPPQGGQGGDHEIAKDVAAQYVEGWDWMPPIRDRNTGIWDEVSISVTGPVKIVDPHVVSTFYDDYERAYLHTTIELENRSAWVADCSLTIQVTIEVEGNFCAVEHIETQKLSIPAGSSDSYTFPPLFFFKPDLWWPNGMGKQSLYNVLITVDVEDFGESDSWSHMFGFRKIESTIDDSTGGRLFKVNGQPVFIRGGNWILSDGLLRLSEKRYQTDIKFHADMNFNMIRCWGGGLTERPEFYHYCDIYGLLVWQEFWITGDCDGRGDPISNPDGPLDHDLFLLCATDSIKLLRNHTSLALWVGGNEQTPPDDINTALKSKLKLHPYFDSNSLENLDPASDDPSQYLDGTRVYIQGSMWDGFANGKGDFTDGPYTIQNPEDFFKDSFYQYGFNPEVGSVGMPVAATIRATMPPEGWEIPISSMQPDGYMVEKANPIWEYHKYIEYSKKGLVQYQIELYGEPKDLDDFCEKAQLVNYIQYRALLEGWTSRMWTKYTGLLIWKTQNPWTGLRGQFYDHLLDQTAGFYGCRCAGEPIHVQLNLATYFIEVVNTTGNDLSNIAVEVSVWDLDGTCTFHETTNSQNLSVPAKTTQTIIEMTYPKSENPKPVYFLLIRLLNTPNSTVISRNFYWLHLPGGNYKLLEPYKLKRVPLKVTSKASITGSSYNVKVSVENTSKSPIFLNRKVQEDTSLLHRIYKQFLRSDNGLKIKEVKGSDSGVAFFLHFSVHSAKKNSQEYDDTRILPVHYSDNYFSLVPGEATDIDISFEVPSGISPQIMLHGWNYSDGVTVYHGK